MWRKCSGGSLPRKQKISYFMAGAVFVQALHFLNSLATMNSLATRQFTSGAPQLLCDVASEPAARAEPSTQAVRPISVVTVFSTQDSWLDDRSGRLGFQRGLGGWSKYTYLHGYTFKTLFFVPSNGERLNWNRVQAALDECRDGAPWVVWMESDIWVTNFDKRIEDVLDAALGKNPDTFFVLNIDAIGNINAGSGFVRCSERGVVGLQTLLRFRTERSDDVNVRAWDANGALILLSQDSSWRPFITFVPAKLYNAYPLHVPEWTRVDQSDADGYWSRGDWLIHFAGFVRGGMFAFANANASELVIGEPDFITMYEA